MKLRALFVITAVLGFVLGFGFFFLPERVMSTFGVSAGEAHQHMARNFGSAVLAMAVMSWFVRNAADSVARRAILIALVIFFTLSSISILLFQLSGIPNMLDGSRSPCLCPLFSDLDTICFSSEVSAIESFWIWWGLNICQGSRDDK
jgi:hypothetical protein